LVQPKLAAEAARASEMGEAPAPPQARRNTTRIQFSDFELGEVLGEGNYSRVFLATLKTTNQQLAIKVRRPGARARSERARSARAT
jgi:serine/threonine protein kinase